MDVIEQVQVAITMVKEARGVPLSASCVVHRGEMIDVLNQVKVAFPADLDRAQEILRQQDQILDEARAAADQLIALAREEAATLISQTEIVASARKESQRILDEVEEEARQQRAEIDSYIDSRLATLEVVLNKTLDVVNRGRDKLGGVETKHALSELSDK
jgi:vacuolar-type H+-ATPase subunit H